MTEIGARTSNNILAKSLSRDVPLMRHVPIVQSTALRYSEKPAVDRMVEIEARPANTVYQHTG